MVIRRTIKKKEQKRKRDNKQSEKTYLLDKKVDLLDTKLCESTENITRMKTKQKYIATS